MSEYIKKEDMMAIINEFMPPSMCKDNILSDMNDLPTIDDKSDLEVIKEYCHKNEGLFCRRKCPVKSACVEMPISWDLDAIKEAFKKIKEAK